MKSLVIGADGMIGSALMQHLYSVDYCDAQGSTYDFSGKYLFLDLSEISSIRSCIDWYNPNTIYLAGAVSNVNNGGSEYARRVNQIAPIWIAAQYPKIKLVFFSSSYVFNGEATGPYDVYSVPFPLNMYGSQKLDAERAVLSYPENVVVRVVSVFGEDKKRKNFGYQIVDALRAKKDIYAYTDQIVSPVLASDVASKTAAFAENGGRGLIHIAGDTHISKYEWALNLADEFGCSSEYIIPADRKSNPQTAPRPVNATLKSTFRVTPYEDSLVRFHELYED